MMEEERLFPIDIHYNKLLDWLLDRRHCDSKWHSQVKVIQERVAQAQKTLPNTEQLAKITQTESPLTYFQCVLIFEELKTTEGEGKTLFGQYTSPRLKEWSDILKLYEKNNAFLAECAQRLMRNVNYEIPALKQQIAKWHQTQRECLRKEGECNVNSTALREKYEASCKEMGIAGVNVSEELTHLVSELPAVFEQVLTALPSILPAIAYYQSFVQYTAQRNLGDADSKFLSMLSYVLKEGNVTVHQWEYGEPPKDMVSSPTQVKSTVQLESRNGNTGLEIDWGEMAADEITPEQSDRTDFEESGIDFNIDAVDLSVITIEDSGEGEERGSSVTVIPETSEATSVGYETVLGATQTRNLFLDDLMELREFLAQRQQELSKETTNILLAGQLGSSSDGFEVQSVESVGEMLSHVTSFLDLLTNSKIQHLFLIKGSPRYLDRLASSLLQHLKLSQRATSQAWDYTSRKAEAAATAASLEPKLTLFITETKSLQTKIAAEISKRYNNRTVNIMGEINQI